MQPGILNHVLHELLEVQRREVDQRGPGVHQRLLGHVIVVHVDRPVVNPEGLHLDDPLLLGDDISVGQVPILHILPVVATDNKFR